MAKISKEEFSSKYKDFVTEDKQIEFLEDVADSFEDLNNVLEEENKTLRAELDDLKEKYKNRFLGKVEDKDENLEIEKEKVIDVEEI